MNNALVFSLLIATNVFCGAIFPPRNSDRLAMKNVGRSGGGNQHRNNIATESRRRLQSWSETAYNWIVQQNCTDSGILCGLPCKVAKELRKRDYRIYAADQIAGEKYSAIFVEGDVKHKSYHDSVLVLDPFPAARFGHAVIAFYVDTSTNSSHCDSVKGFMIDNSTCMQPIHRVPYSKNFNFRSRFLVPKVFCQEMLFLPLVYLQKDSQDQMNDQLECRGDIEGFHQTCPELRPKSQTNTVDCHRLNTNRDCGFLENSLRGRCSASQTCDHAILLSGGWNRQLSDVESFKNIFKMKDLLMKHGFRDNNIEMFLANGEQRNNVEKEEKDGTEDDIPLVTVPPAPVTYRSTTTKNSMRNHIRTLCDTKQCADSLLIYLNSPAMMDGTSLLWDLYDNGVYDDSEVYTPKELMRDIGHCRANRVIIIADQSYGEELVAAAESRSISLSNVIIITSTVDFNFESSNKDRLTHYLFQNERNDICLNDLKNNFSDHFKLPVYVGAQANLLNSTLVGGPCFENTTSLNDPRTEQFRGCRLSPNL